jgi:hypothetical protein
VGGQDRHWGQLRLAIPAGALKPGANRLTLRNTTPWEGYLGLPYVLINSAELRGE